MAEAKLDKGLLRGLQVTDVRIEKTKGEESGKETEKPVAFKRSATEDDVLSFREAGDAVVLVMKDGRKHTVKKEQKKAAN